MEMTAMEECKQRLIQPDNFQILLNGYFYSYDHSLPSYLLGLYLWFEVVP